MKRLISILLTAALVVQVHAVKLEYKYQKGQALNYELVMDSASSFTSPGGSKRELKMKTIIKMKQELIDTDADGVMKVAMTILDAQQEVNGVKKDFMSATNQTQIVRMLRNGKVLSALSQIPGHSPDQNAMQMVFPAEQLKVGDTWTQLKDIAQPIPIETRTLYKITKLLNNQATISSIMKLKNTAGDSVQAQTKGNTVFDVENGKIVESFADSKFQFEIPLRVDGLIPNNSNVKVTLHMKMRIKEIKMTKEGKK